MGSDLPGRRRSTSHHRFEFAGVGAFSVVTVADPRGPPSARVLAGSPMSTAGGACTVKALHVPETT